ncbi:MAG: Hsp20/alpha crystallin family protein [Bdellovibrionales bacterium]
MNLPSVFRRSGNEAIRGLARLQNDFESLLQELTEEPRFEGAEFSPSCELTEDKANYIVKFDMPGVKKEDINIEVDGRELSVSAERRSEKRSDEKKRHYTEISYGSYQRSFTLPSSIDEKRVGAKFDNGVLTLTVPKTESAHAKQIAIQ